MRIVPVRHHSPANAGRLASDILATRPRCILIEGPADATPLIPHLLAEDTRPPVAILAYYPPEGDAPPLSALWPFSSYSPEWVALQAGAEVGAELRFMDAPAGHALSRRAEVRRVEEADGEDTPDTPFDVAPQEPLPHVLNDMAREFGFDSYYEFWEARFEMARGDDLLAAMGEFGALVRAQPSPDPRWTAFNDEREAWMRQEMRRALDDGFDTDEVMVVCGAAHALALDESRDEGDADHVAALREVAQARTTLIPYSFLRLSEQVGYGAGNHAPAYYQTVWESGLDFEAATQEYLIKLVHAMQGAGFAVSTADAIEANRLALTLAGMRDKPMPGYFELREAAQTCFGRGQREVNAFLVPLTIGDAVGSITGGVERTTVQEEFYASVASLGLPLSDSGTSHTLDLTDARDVQASIFLHRLRAIDVPYGQLGGKKGSLRGDHLGSLLSRIQGKQTPKGPDYSALLGQLRETWALQWTPATDISLLEKSIEGTTLEEVCRRLFRRWLDDVRNVGQASDMLMRIVLAGLTGLYDEALALCESISAHDQDIAGQARAAQKLQQLLAYGGSRALNQAPIGPLLRKVFTRAVFLLPAAAAVADDAVGPVVESVKVLYEVTRRSEQADEGVLIRRLQRTLDSEDAHPSVRGLCVALLFLGGHIAEDDLLRHLRHSLSSGDSPLRAAYFLEGLLSVNRTVVLRNLAVVTLLDEFVGGLSFDAFVAALPAMRRAFSTLSRPELEYVVSTLLNVLGLEAAEAASVAQALSEEELVALNEEINRRMGGD